MEGKTSGQAAQVSLLDGQATSVSGQAVLPGMQSDVGYDAAVLESWQEKFCWEYVENGGVGYRAYMAVKPKVKKTTATAEASKLLTSPNIAQRIQQLLNEVGARCRFVIINKRLLAASLDRRKFLQTDMKTPKPLKDLTAEQASLVDLDYAYDKAGNLVMVPSLMGMERAVSELTRISGLYKDSIALTDKDGGPIDGRNVSDIDLSNRLLTLIAGLEERANGQ